MTDKLKLTRDLPPDAVCTFANLDDQGDDNGRYPLHSRHLNTSGGRLDLGHLVDQVSALVNGVRWRHSTLMNRDFRHY